MNTMRALLTYFIMPDASFIIPSAGNLTAAEYNWPPVPFDVKIEARRRAPREVSTPPATRRASVVRAETFREERMSRHRGDWDDDFYAGEPRPRRRGDEGRYGRPAGWRYEYDERDAAREGRG